MILWNIQKYPLDKEKKKRKESLERRTDFAPQRYMIQKYGSHKH